ncbi:MAG: hypothetical protein NVS3B21_19250 [Acidimicrobiales bacterium]
MIYPAEYVGALSYTDHTVEVGALKISDAHGYNPAGVYVRRIGGKTDGISVAVSRNVSPSWWGEEHTEATLVDMYLAEMAVHAWDLARATEQLVRLDPPSLRPHSRGHGP